MNYLNGSRSSFPNAVDQIKEQYDLSPSQLTQANRWQVLKLKADKSPAEIEEYNTLTIALSDFLFGAEEFNKAFDMVIATQKHYRDNTVGFVEGKQQEMNTYVDGKKQEINSEISNFDDLGNYNPSTQYYPKNFVHYNGEVYISLIKNLNKTPSDNGINWTKLTIKGDTGYGVSLSPKGTFLISTQYHPDDLVQYNGTLYRCILNSKGNYPTNEVYWELFLSGSGESLQDLNTNDNTSMVGAINEVNEKADTSLNGVNSNNDKIGILNGDGVTKEKANKTDLDEHKAEDATDAHRIDNIKGLLEALNTGNNKFYEIEGPTQTIPSLNTTNITYDTLTPYNNADFCTLESGRIKVLVKGVYEIIFTTRFSNNSNGRRQLYAHTSRLVQSQPAVQGAGSFMVSNTTQEIEAGTILILGAYQNGGVALDITSNYALIRKVG